MKITNRPMQLAKAVPAKVKETMKTFLATDSVSIEGDRIDSLAGLIFREASIEKLEAMDNAEGKDSNPEKGIVESTGPIKSSSQFVRTESGFEARDSLPEGAGELGTYTIVDGNEMHALTFLAEGGEAVVVGAAYYNSDSPDSAFYITDSSAFGVG